MSGLYNMLMGRNPAFGILMSAAGIHRNNGDQFGRVRDCWISEDAKTIGVLHRNYGGEGQAANDAAAALPLFKERQECGSDKTYAYWIFDVPTEGNSEEVLATIAELSDNTPCMERYMQAVEDMSAGKKTPQTEKMLEVGSKLMEKIADSFKTGESSSVDTDDGGIDIVPHIISGGDL